MCISLYFSPLVKGVAERSEDGGFYGFKVLKIPPARPDFVSPHRPPLEKRGKRTAVSL